jgi:dienelactone hydrolase
MSSVESIQFVHHDAQLAGTLYKPALPGPAPVVIVVHSAQGGERSFPFYRHLTRHLPAAGIAVLLYDRRGSGESTGDFQTADFPLLAADAQAAATTLAERSDIDAQRIGVYGVSQGGWIAPLVAGLCPTIALLVIVSGCGVTPAEQMSYSARTALEQAGYPTTVGEQVTALRQRVDAYYRGALPRASVQAEINEVRNEPWFPLAFIHPNLPEDVLRSKWFQEMDYEPVAAWRRLQQPTLFLYGERDDWVPIEASMKRYRAATAHMKDVTIARIAGTDHLMSDLASGTDAGVSGIVSPTYLSVLRTWLWERFRMNAAV